MRCSQHRGKEQCRQLCQCTQFQDLTQKVPYMPSSVDADHLHFSPHSHMSFPQSLNYNSYYSISIFPISCFSSSLPALAIQHLNPTLILQIHFSPYPQSRSVNYINARMSIWFTSVYYKELPAVAGSFPTETPPVAHAKQYLNFDLQKY